MNFSVAGIRWGLPFCPGPPSPPPSCSLRWPSCKQPPSSSRLSSRWATCALVLLCCAVRCSAVRCSAPRASLKNLPPRDTAHPRKHQSPSACDGTAVVKRKWLRHIWFWLSTNKAEKNVVRPNWPTDTESDSQGYNKFCIRVEVRNRTSQK